MIVLDTHIWLWWVNRDTGNLAQCRIEQIANAAIEDCGSLKDIVEASGLSGYSGYYRIPFDYRYRISAYVANNTVKLLRVGHREDFYKYFSPE